MAAKKGGKKGEGKKERKGKLRAIKKLTKVVEAHAKRYRAQLDENWAQSDLSRKEAEVILRRMDRVLEQLPEARQQAHDRIIGERAVANEKKILSLYQDHVHVIVRGKAGAEVEFGNSLFLAENAQGLIIDFELLRESSPGDAQWLQQRYEAMKSATGGRLCAVVADRGFESKATREMLEADGTFECLCPRDPERLSQRMNEDEAFAGAMQRRAQTEGRVGILKNVFLGGTPLAKGFEHRQIQVAWAVLAHNLWVAARQKWKIPEQAAGQAA